MKKILFLLAAASVMFAACDPQNEEPKAATVTVAAGDVTTSSVTFTVTSENATAVAYVCVEGAAPTAESVLQSGTAVEANTTATVTVSDLKDGVAYTVVAAAMNELGAVLSNVETMTTTEIPANPQVSVAEVEASDKYFIFTVTPSDAAKCAYKVYAEGETATADDVLANGTEVSATSETEVTIEGLEDGTYFVVAAVEKRDKKVMSESLSFAISNLDVMIVGETYYDTYVKYFKDYGDGALECGLQLKYRDEQGTQCNIILHFDLDQSATCLPEGTYELLPEGSPITVGTLRFDYCEHSTADTDYFFMSLKVTVTHVDGKYRFQGEGVQYDSWAEEITPHSKLVFDITADIPKIPIM